MGTTEVPAEDLLAAMKSSSWLEVRAAVQQAGTLLRVTPNNPLSEQLREQLLQLTKHNKWEVKKAVIEAVESLRDDRFKPALSRLLDDDNEYVRAAAKRALSRSAALSRADLLKEEHDDLIAGWLSDLEANYGTRVRDEALRVSRKYAELLVREAQHELTRVITKLDLALKSIALKLERKVVDAKACRAQIARAQEHARFLVAFLKLLRQVTTEIKPEFSEEPLHEIFEEAASLVDHPKRGRIALVMNVRESIRVEADRGHLVQAFTNLLQNAFEAYDAGARGAIEVSAVVRDDQVSIRIEDEGRGMTEEARSEAFRLFTTRKQDGLGFGLPLARQIIVHVHRGEIELISKKGKGTTVTIVLPLVQDVE